MVGSFKGLCSTHMLQIRAGNLGPALQWAEEHRSELVASSGERVATAFEFKLYRLQFLDVLAKQGARSILALWEVVNAGFGACRLQCGWCLHEEVKPIKLSAQQYFGQHLLTRQP